jgi:ABC-2 type transport system ATP-binding protein
MSLRLHAVSKRFGRQQALDGVSLHVRSGDCFGFLGHNGAGKTTAIRIALGLMRPDSGRVVVDGFDARSHVREARARIGGLVETPGFHGRLDGSSNLRLLARLQGLGGRAARREADRVLGLVGLADVGGKPVRAYSQGMRQRLGIAQALLGRPRYVLLDEPANGLDPEGIEEIRRLLAELAREDGVTVLLSSHQLHELAGLCNRIAILRQGRLLVEEETERLLAAEGGRYLLRTPDAAAARERLAALDVAVDVSGEQGLTLDLGGADPAQVAGDLVGAGVRLAAFAPRPPTLEEVYLRYTRDAEAGTGATDDEPAPVEPPAERRAPPLPVLRMMRHEAARWLSGASVPLLLVAPALLAAGGVALRWQEARQDAAKVAEGEVFSATSVTAFEGVGVGLRASLLLAAVVLAGIASQSVAGELARGTLRNVLLRPLRRFQVAAGKAFAVFGVALLCYALLAGTARLTAGTLFEFGDVVEILTNGEPYPLVPASELWPELAAAFRAPVVPLLAYASLGFLAGAIAQTGVGGLGLAMSLVVILEMLRLPARSFGLEHCLPSAYLPSPLSDSSFLATYLDLARGVSNPTQPAGGSVYLVPLIWTAASLGLGTLLLSRRSVP